MYRKYKNIIIYSFVILLLFIPKLLFLENDLPAWNITYYTPLDEGCYGMEAIQMTRSDITDFINELHGKEYQTWNSSVSFLLTVITRASLTVFGNNYYGLRMGCVFSGLMVSIIVLWIIRDVIKENSAIRPILIWAIVELSFDFSYALENRILEPTIFRTVTIIVIVWLIYKVGIDSIWKLLIFGGVTALSVSWGYMTNAFAVLAGMLFCLLQRENRIKKTSFYCIGGIVGTVISEIIMYCVQRRTFVQDTIQILGRQAGRISFSLSSIKGNVQEIIQSNMYCYNGLLLALTVVSIIACANHCFKEGFSGCEGYVTLLLTCFFVQGIFTSDFLMRKEVLIFPLLLLETTFCAKNVVENSSINTINRKVLLCLSLFATAAAIFFSAHRLLRISNLEMTDTVKYCIIILNILVNLAFVVFMYDMRKESFYIILSLSLMLSIFMDYQYILKQDQTEKDTMIEIGETVGNDGVLGMGYSYCLYNSFIPVQNNYDLYYLEDFVKRTTDVIEKDNIKYLISYKNVGTYGNIADEIGYEIKLIDRYYTSYNVETGKDDEYDIYLYEIVKG